MRAENDAPTPFRRGDTLRVVEAEPGLFRFPWQVGDYVTVRTCYPDTVDVEEDDAQVHWKVSHFELAEPHAEQDALAQTEERLARALLTIAEVESAVTKIERYLETNGQYLDLDCRVPMERQTEAMRNALTRWKAERDA